MSDLNLQNRIIVTFAVTAQKDNKIFPATTAVTSVESMNQCLTSLMHFVSSGKVVSEIGNPLYGSLILGFDLSVASEKLINIATNEKDTKQPKLKLAE